MHINTPYPVKFDESILQGLWFLHRPVNIISPNIVVYYPKDQEYLQYFITW